MVKKNDHKQKSDKADAQHHKPTAPVTPTSHRHGTRPNGSGFRTSPRESLWFPATPKHWSIIRAKHLFLHMNRAVRDGDQTITCFRDGTVTTRHSRRTDGFTESLKEIGYQGVRNGDLVVHTMDALAGAIGVSDADGKATPVYCVCSPRPNVNAHYYGYLLREMARTGWIAALAKGVRERSCDFRWSEFGSQRLPVPPALEQMSIVRFVKQVDRQIREIIAGKQRITDSLDEERQVVLRRAVTRGIDGRVYLRASGVPWLGEIPEHWSVRRVKAVAQILNGGTPSTSAPSYWDGPIRWITPDDLGSIFRTHNLEWRTVHHDGRLCGVRRDHRASW